MQHLPLDARGYPIPTIVYRDGDGKPHFTVNEESLRQHVIRMDECSICGGKLLRGRWYVGGFRSAFHPHGAYLDPAMHAECAEYALKVCPYLANPSYTKRIEARTVKKDDPTPLVIDPTMDPKRPELFVAIMTTGQRYNRHENPVLAARNAIGTIVPKRPYVQVQYWVQGKHIPFHEAQAIISEHYVKTDDDLLAVFTMGKEYKGITNGEPN